LDEGFHRGTTFESYWVADSSVSVLGRNKLTGLQVWSGEQGYPGDADYREFHRRDERSGLRYWRVTGSNVDLGDKDFYHLEWARERVHQHARHFASLVEAEVARYHGETGRHGVVTCAYDTELFGHWWFEGIPWIAEVLRLLARSDTVALSTASDFVHAHPPETALDLPASSWGQGGGDFVWLNPDTEWMWPLIHGAERRMESLLARHPEPTGTALELIRQTCREALLLQSSDWPFLITTGQAAEYAADRFRSHLDRFDQLATVLERGPGTEADRSLAADLYERDKIFADIDYRRFASQDRLAGTRPEA
jgi:1,4-alpha-glucan branching enzyme